MGPLLCLVTVTAALAGLPATALAKGIAGAQVCGAAGCHDVDARFFHAALPEGDPLPGAIAAAPFVTLLVTYQHPDATPQRFAYVPSLGVIRADGATAWIRLYPGRRAELDALLDGIAPQPAARLGGSAVTRPASGATTRWWPIAGTTVAALALLALLGRYATSARNARPRASKSAN